MAVLGLRFCARAFSSCGKRGSLFIAVRRPLTTAASLGAEHRLQTRRLSSCGSRAQPLRGMWDPPRPGPEPVSPASAGRLSTTAPPGKPYSFLIINHQQIIKGSCFLIQSATLCLLSRAFNPLTFKVIIDRYVLISIVLNLVFQLIYTMEYYSAIKRNEIMPFAATWMSLEMIILSEVSQKEKDKYHMVSLICGI